jgi:Domain of unknown function (DUF4082)/Abnormal spindle-like microcephaly-assoc'd, ASPM-SPD-2-Hydin
MSASATPSQIDSNDPNPVEIGVKFRADTNGSVTGLRFYKTQKNVGTHVGHIWSRSGVLLGSATFTGETKSGWQQVNFLTPIPVSANTTYIASYFAPSGRYSDNTGQFAKAGIDNPPLHALANGVDGPDGVYLYSSSSGFPTSTYESTNYWVDIVYTPQTTVATPQLTSSASTLSFGSVAVNSSATGSVTLTSSGTAAVTVNSASIAGAGFSIVAGSFPVTLNPNQSVTLKLQFLPTTAGAATGKLTISSNSTSGSTAAVALSGTGVAANPQLTVSATSLSFGSDAVSTATTKALTLTSAGTSPVTISTATISGAEFTTVGGSFPLTLNPAQTATLQVQFLPTVAGAVTGQLTISSNSTSGSTAAVALSGTGTAAANSVSLSWTAPTGSTDPVVGYNVYRSLNGGSPQLLNSTPMTATAYVDSSVAAGSTYDYTAESVDANGVQSVASNQIAVTIP